MSAARNENEINNDDNTNNIIFTIKVTKLYVPVVTLKGTSKGFERSVYCNEYKTKSEDKNTTIEFRYFLESSFVGVNRLFVLVYPNQSNDSKRFFAQKYHFPKCIIKNYNLIFNGKKLL